MEFLYIYVFAHNNFGVNYSQLYCTYLFTNRLISFDLEIASIISNGSCLPLREGNVVLSYRVGTSRQWKTIEEYSSAGK